MKIENNVDLVCVSESWARKSQPIEDVIKMDNYTVICNTNLQRQIDGTPAIIVNSSKFIDIEEDRYKFVDDLTLVTLVNLKTAKLETYNVKEHVPSHIPTHNTIIRCENLRTQKDLERINKWTNENIYKEY